MGISDAFRLLRRQYLEHVNIHSIEIEGDASSWTEENQKAILDVLRVESSSLDRELGVYEYRLTKKLVEHIEKLSIVYVIDELYEFVSELSTRQPKDNHQGLTLSWSAYECSAFDTPVKIQTDCSIISAQGTTGVKVWPASQRLAEFLIQYPQIIIPNANILEIGCGNGFLSAVISKIAPTSSILATDNSTLACELATKTMVASHCNNVNVRPISWDQINHADIDNLDYVVGADIFFDEAVADSLFRSLNDIIESNPDAKLLFAATIRNQQTFSKFQESAESLGLTFEFINNLSFESLFFYEKSVPIELIYISRSRHDSTRDFNEKVYKVVSQIPRGKVTTYGCIARMIGKPRHSRMVGAALKGLSEGSSLPWHRVINSRGGISQREKSDSVSEQIDRLKSEGVLVTERPQLSKNIQFDAELVNLKKYGWFP